MREGHTSVWQWAKLILGAVLVVAAPYFPAPPWADALAQLIGVTAAGHSTALVTPRRAVRHRVYHA
jgi:hypothetical protein